MAKENKFKGTLHCVMRSIHDSTPFILGYTQGESGYNVMSKSQDAVAWTSVQVGGGGGGGGGPLVVLHPVE